jgi:DNA repair exonuclease SbcCD ATPase subunit
MALAAFATQLSFTLEAQNQRAVQINGQPLQSHQHELQIVDATEIHIDTIGLRLRVTPGIQDKQTLLTTLQNANQVVDTLKLEIGFDTVEEAEVAFDKKRRLSEEAQQKSRESQLHAPGNDFLGLQAGHAALGQYLKEKQDDFEQQLVSNAHQVSISREDLKTEVQNCEKLAEDMQIELNQTKGKLSELLRQWESFKNTYIRQQVELNQAEKELVQIEQRLQSFEANISSFKLERSVSDKSSQLEKIQQTIQILKEKKGMDSLEQLEARINRLDEQITNRRKRASDLETSIAGLISRIQALEGDGLQEKIETESRDIERLQKRRDWFEREIKVLKLLEKVLKEAEADAKTQYLAPVVKKIRPHLQILFPKSTLKIDERFQITSMTRSGTSGEAFNNLSYGTQEQIAILTRLAFAEMLIEQGKPAMLVLDDALIFADDERLASMFDILTIAAQKMQIIVFTCHQKGFDSLGGNRLIINQ